MLRGLAYDPYGRVTVLTSNWMTRSSSSYDWRYLHQGGRYDSVSGLYHFRDREKSPTLGRWLQVDPWGFNAGDTNLYRDEGNRPTSLTDPTGHGNCTSR
jgi:RHS repeat-associated protein